MFQFDLWVMESNVFVKSIIAVHICGSPLVTFLFNRSVSSGYNLTFSIVVNSLYKADNAQIGR